MTPVPDPDMVAQWLLLHEAEDHPSADALVTTAARVHARLRVGLMVFLGPAGFDSLWTRALHVVQPPVPASIRTGAGPVPLLPLNDQAAMRDDDAVVASFIALLFTFVGADLGVRLLHTIWPALPLGESAPPTSET